MNPGPVEEAGQTARSVVDALKGAPLVFALLVFNGLFLAMLTYAVMEERAEMRTLLGNMLKACLPSP